jgi:hypothetical protein
MANLSEERAVRELRARGLGHAKVDHLGHRPAVVQRDQDIGGFQIAMDDALLMRVLHRLADRHEQLQTLLRRQVFLVAVLGNGQALDQLHDEIGSCRVRRASVQHLGDVGVVHHRQRLAFLLEAGNHLVRVHSRLDDLNRNLALHRL